jgi:hypothetical protein
LLAAPKKAVVYDIFKPRGLLVRAGHGSTVCFWLDFAGKSARATLAFAVFVVALDEATFFFSSAARNGPRLLHSDSIPPCTYADRRGVPVRPRR